MQDILLKNKPYFCSVEIAGKVGAEGKGVADDFLVHCNYEKQHPLPVRSALFCKQLSHINKNPVLVIGYFYPHFKI